MAGAVSEEKEHLETLDNIVSSDKLVCEPCLYDETQEEAIGFCKACAEYLCQRCIKEHKKAKMTRQHLILTDSLPDKPKVVKAMKKLVCCSEHPDMSVTAKCIDHGVYICSICFKDTHRRCEITNTSEWKNNEHGTKEIYEGFDELVTMSCSVKSSIEEHKKKTYFDAERIKKDIETYIQKIIDSVKILEKRSKEEAEAAVANALSELEKGINVCEEIQNVGEYNKSLLEAAIEYGDDNDKKILVDILENKMKLFKERIQSLNEKPLPTIQFTANSELPELPSVGNLTLNRDEQSHFQHESHIGVSSDALDEEKMPAASGNITSEDCVSGHLENLSGNHSCDETVHNCRDTDDTEQCVIYKIIILDDGSLTLLDYNNSKLKVLNADFSFKGSLILNDNPLDMCRIEQDSVAVIFNSEKRVNKYRIEHGIIKYVGSFLTHLYCLGIAAYRNDEIAILMSDKPYLVIRDGKADIHEIQIRQIGNGRVIKIYDNFSAIGDMKPCLTIRNARRLIFTGPQSLVLMEMGRVMAFTLIPSKCEAEEKWFYVCSSDRMLRDVRDIMYDGQHLYVCADHGGVLEMSSKNGRNRKVIIDIAAPRSIAIDRNRNIMIVGCTYDDYIHVYRYK